MKFPTSTRVLLPGLLVAFAATRALPALSQAQPDQSAKRVVVVAPPVPPGVLSANTPDNPIYDVEALGLAQIEATKRVCFESRRRLLLNLGTNACGPPCVAFNKAVYSERFYEPLIKQLIPVFVDVTPGSRNDGLLAKYGIDASKGLPAVVIFDSEHKILEVTRNGEMVEVAKKGPEAVQEWLLARFQKD